MAMTNTFHTSKAAHAIRNGKDAARVQRHNSRGYFSMEYDRSKIHSIVGEADEISWNIEDYINNTFQKNIDDYNERQVRKDRKIDQTAYEYFCENKNLDIANEMIFQIGDMDFWERWREEEVRTTRKGKEIVIKSFPEEVKNVMDDIFLKQAEAYETIYETHVAQGKLGVDILQNLSGSVDRLVNRSGMLRDRKLEESLKNAFRGYSEALNDIVDKLCKYEIAYQVEEPERLSSPIVTAKKNLEDQMNAAKRRKLTEEELAERIAENYLRYAEERSLTESETLTEALFKFAAVIITKGEIDFVTEEEREKCTNRAVELAAKIIEKRERNFQNQEFHH